MTNYYSLVFRLTGIIFFLFIGSNIPIVPFLARICQTAIGILVAPNAPFHTFDTPMPNLIIVVQASSSFFIKYCKHTPRVILGYPLVLCVEEV